LRSNAVVRFDAADRPSGLCGTSQVVDPGPALECTLRPTVSAIRRVIREEAVRTAFQPIVRLTDRRVLGVEALSRFTLAGDERSPENWFLDAAQVGLLVDLEVHALRLALQAAGALPAGLDVAVNLSPETLMWPGLRAALAQTPVAPERIIVEVTEHSSVQDYDELQRALRPLRKAGMRIAVDDAGAGYASFRHILALSPEVIKLDRTLVAGIDADPARRALAAAVVAFATETGSRVTAEGIERAAELHTVTRLGVECGQGYLFGSPTTAWQDWSTWESEVGPHTGAPFLGQA
jgi:EAL domain-containing protein (putative c-di-GMP-specific phosphodiesterase class I)